MDDREYADALRRAMEELTVQFAHPTDIDVTLRGVTANAVALIDGVETEDVLLVAGPDLFKSIAATSQLAVEIDNFQKRFRESLEEIAYEEWDYTFKFDVGSFFYLTKSALPHMGKGASIIGSSSVNSDSPNPTLAPYAATKAAIANFSASLAQLLGPRGIRVNSVAPGPIWTPLILSTMDAEKVKSFGDNVPLGRAGQPAELAPVYVLLASDDASYVSGARVAVTGGRPIL